MTFFTDFSPLSSRMETALSSRGVGVPEVRRSRARLPRGFRPIVGVPSNVRFGGTVPRNLGRTAAQKLGLAYEQRIHDVLSAIYGDHFVPHPAILYNDRRGLRRAIPDGTLRLGDILLIVEIKLSHTERAWWQLTRLYAPLLRELFPTLTIRGVEICRSYDPNVVFPEPQHFIQSLHALPPRGVGVLQWKI